MQFCYSFFFCCLMLFWDSSLSNIVFLFAMPSPAGGSVVVAREEGCRHTLRRTSQCYGPRCPEELPEGTVTRWKPIILGNCHFYIKKPKDCSSELVFYVVWAVTEIKAALPDPIFFRSAALFNLKLKYTFLNKSLKSVCATSTTLFATYNTSYLPLTTVHN